RHHPFPPPFTPPVPSVLRHVLSKCHCHLRRSSREGTYGPCSQHSPASAYPPLVASRCRCGWYGPFRPCGWSTVLEPPWRAWPLTVLEQSSRHCPPQRLNARNKTAAFLEKVVRHSAGTVRMLGRYITPSCGTLGTWRTQVAAETL